MKTQGIETHNLLHVVKKRLVNAHEINQYLKSNPDVKRNIGSLPIDFFAYIPQENRSFITKEIADIFEKFSTETEDLENPNNVYVYSIQKIAENMVQRLKEVLNRTDIKSSYVDSGSFKNCQKIEIGNFAYALSTFKKFPLFDPRGYFRDSHGKGNEPQNIFTSYYNYSKGRVCRPFLAKISAEKDSGSFILSKFIDDTHEKKCDRGNFISNRSFLRNIDVLGNSINGIFIEAGGFIENKKYINDRNLRKTWQKFASCLDSNVTLLNKANANRVQDDMLKAIDNGLNIYEENSVQSYLENLPKTEQSLARKLIKQARRITELKQKSIEEGSFGQISSLLKEDLCDLYSFETYSLEFNEKSNPIDIYKDYPRLLAQILGINNAPSLKEMLFLLDSHCCCVDIDLTKYYTRKDVKDLLTNNFQEIKNLFSFEYLENCFGINPNANK